MMKRSIKNTLLLALFALFGMGSMVAQRQVSGTVVDDATGETLPLVTITIKGITTTGTTSSIDGKFSITIPAGKEPILVFRFMGYQTLELPVGETNTVDVRMKLEATALDAVVITGMGVIDKASYVGSVSQVNLESIIIPSEMSIDNMLQGAVAGMLVTNESGMVGSKAKIQIRGTTTLLGNQDPIWVVDGVVQRDALASVKDNMGASGSGGDVDEMRQLAASAISWLNPNDIETLNVLKDASATAIYGSQAANGVIVITTKKATAGSLAVSYNGNFSVGQKPTYSMYNLMNSQELMQFSKEMYEGRHSYSGTILPVGFGGLIQRLNNKEISYDEYVTEFRKMENMNTDWFDLLFRNTFNHSHSISLAGGNQLITNRTSFNMSKNLGEAIGNDQSNLSASSNTAIRLADDRVLISLSVTGSLASTTGFAFGVSPFDYASRTSRTIPLYNDDGTLFYHARKPGNKQGSSAFNDNQYYLYNILNEMDNTGTTSSTQRASATVDAKIKILEGSSARRGLDFQTLFNYTINSTEGRQWATEFSHYATTIRGYEYGTVVPNSIEQRSSYLPHGGVLRMENALGTGYSFRNNLLYQESFNKKHNVTLQLGMELRSNNASANASDRYGYQLYRGQSFALVPTTYLDRNEVVTANPLHEDMGTSTRITSAVNNYISQFMTAVYNFDGRYVVNFNARMDASNRFGQDKNKRFEPNWSAGVKWRLGAEKFMSFLTDKRWLDMIDLSFSYGYTGNAVESVGPELIAGIPNPSLNPSFLQNTLNLNSLPYPGLGWEKTNDWNAGLDFSFFDGRMSAVLSGYGRKSDVLGARTVPVENGMASAIIIGNKVENKGMDLTVNLNIIRTKDFTWNMSYNASLSKNSVVDVQNEYTYADYINGTAIIEDQPYRTFYSYAYKGIDPTTGFPMFYFMDTLGTGLTDNPLDIMVRSGRTDPDFFGGFSTLFRYKEFSLRAQFAVSFGAQKRLPSLYSSTLGIPTPDQNVSRDLLDRWKNPGDENRPGVIPGVPGSRSETEIRLPLLNDAYTMLYDMYNYSDARVANADFIRCRSISLAYDLPTKITKLLHVKRASVSFNLSNPFLIAFDKDWEGYDPETGGWPARKTTSLSINLSL